MLRFTTEISMQKIPPNELAELIVAAQKNPARFDKLYDQFVHQVYRYLYSRLGNEHEAEDVTSQTFITAYESLPQYREQGHFTAWLFRIAQNKMNDHFRKNKLDVNLNKAKELSLHDDVLGNLIRDEELTKLKSIILRLSQDQQELIRLRYIAELSFVEMGNLLRKREDTVKKSVYRLLAHLKSQME